MSFVSNIYPKSVERKHSSLFSLLSTSPCKLWAIEGVVFPDMLKLIYTKLFTIVLLVKISVFNVKFGHLVIVRYLY